VHGCLARTSKREDLQIEDDLATTLVAHSNADMVYLMDDGTYKVHDRIDNEAIVL
jgi:hypothetical protein